MFWNKHIIFRITGKECKSDLLSKSSIFILTNPFKLKTTGEMVKNHTPVVFLIDHFGNGAYFI
jgi:hypothetical protein